MNINKDKYILMYLVPTDIPVGYPNLFVLNIFNFLSRNNIYNKTIVKLFMYLCISLLVSINNVKLMTSWFEKICTCHQSIIWPRPSGNFPFSRPPLHPCMALNWGGVGLTWLPESVFLGGLKSLSLPLDFTLDSQSLLLACIQFPNLTPDCVGFRPARRFQTNSYW